jgi:hypothetical protein
MNLDDVDKTGQAFLKLLYEQTEGNLALQASMYEIGQSLGMDKDTSLKTAEMLMGSELVEVRNLSGAIGLTHGGVTFIETYLPTQEMSNEEGIQLPDETVLDAGGIQRVDQLTAELKLRIATFKLDFDTLSELMCDLKTISAQLESSRPKTAIVREALKDIKVLLTNAKDTEGISKITSLLGD